MSKDYVVIKFKKLHPDAQVPVSKHGPEEDAGHDLFALEDVTLTSFEPVKVRTGIAVEIPSGYEGQIRPRSGLAVQGVTVTNSPGTIDPSYRGEVMVILQWITQPSLKRTMQISKGDRIAQMVIAPYAKALWVKTVEEEGLSETSRGEGGFGSTGK